MIKDYKTLYKRLCTVANEYDKGLITKENLADELGYFILYQLDTRINPYLKKVENNFERILINDRL